MENEEKEKHVKVDESELQGYTRRLRSTKEDIADGCVCCNAMRQAKRAQRHSEYCRRPVQEDLRSTEEGRERVNKAEE